MSIEDPLVNLKKLNFQRLIKIDNYTDKYDFKEYLNNNRQHRVVGYCTICEKSGCNNANDGSQFKLSHISHGAHSQDFFDSIPHFDLETTSWHEEPVLFLFESPSIDYDETFRTILCDDCEKKPTHRWYWIHNEQQSVEFPKYFTGGAYGELFLSIILTFKLKNAYITNLVKCGLNDENGKFRGITFVKEECIKNCFANFLKKEIAITNPKIIFTFGSNVHWWLEKCLESERSSFDLINLPHPAGRRRGFKDTFYKVLYFWQILTALYKNKIVDEKEVEKFAITFVKK